jgi:hypothetical protein
MAYATLTIETVDYVDDIGFVPGKPLVFELEYEEMVEIFKGWNSPHGNEAYESAKAKVAEICSHLPITSY